MTSETGPASAAVETSVRAAVWHRHWMELRGGFMVAAIVAAVLCVVFPVLVGLGIEDAARYGRTSPWLRTLADRRDALGLETVAAWGAHATTAALGTIVLGLFLSGTGIRTNNLAPGHPSLLYTLTLPVLRRTLIWTRFAAAVAAVVAIFAAMLAINAVVLRIAGWPLPLWDMARTTTIAIAVIVAVMAAFGGPLTIWNEVVGGTAFTLAVVSVAVMGFPFVVGIMTSNALAPIAGGSAAIVLISLTLAGTIAARKDF